MWPQWGWSVYAVSGHTLANGVTNVASIIAAVNQANGGRVNVLSNYGTNDLAVLPVEATWRANYQTIIDAIMAAQPGARIYIVKPWKRGYTANANTMAGWIDTIVAANPGVAFVGHDERTWLEGGDDGATMTIDGVHYSAAGQAECAAQWKAIIQP